MDQVSPAIKEFFENFEQSSNTFEGNLLALQFSDPFMTADPDGAIQVAKKDEFIAGTTKRKKFFQSLGFQLVKILSLEETRLDSHYVMAKVHWLMRFEKDPGKPVDLTSHSTYILFIKGDSPKIVFFLTHENLVKIMQDRGLLPNK